MVSYVERELLTQSAIYGVYVKSFLLTDNSTAWSE